MANCIIFSRAFFRSRQPSTKSFQTRVLRSPSPSRSFARKFSSSSYSRNTQGTINPQPPTASLPSRLRRTLGLITIAVVFTGAGFTMSTIPAFKAANGILNPPSDEETLAMFTPDDDAAREVEDFIQNHPVTLEFRSKPDFSESRPHLKMPVTMRAHSLTAGTLMGQGKVVVPPLAFNEEGGKSMVSISYLGKDLCGHPGIIHGGFLATMLDEGMARCCFAALPNKVGMTANLNINYRAPAPAGTFVVLRAKTTKVEGRKAWVEGHIETLVGEGETPVILADATALFIEPRQAAAMARAYPVGK